MATRDQGRQHKAAVSNLHRDPASSLRVRLIRLGLRVLLKNRSYSDVRLPGLRRRFRFLTRLVPRPPRGTQTIAVNAGGVPASCIATPASLSHRHMLYLHGGAYDLGSPAMYRDFTWRIARAARTRLLCIDYRLAPEHPFPAALEDAVKAYRWLLDEGADPKHVGFMGDSAGGGLTLATLLKLRDDGAPLPAAAVVLSPWTDLALTGETLRTKAAVDPMISGPGLPIAAKGYLAGADPRDPYASPLYGDPAGLPPTLILVGTDEVLLDDSLRMADKMRAAGCEVEADVWPGMFHVWLALARLLPEARAAIARVGAFLDDKL
jgi:acetyl esterase/lipase